MVGVFVAEPVAVVATGIWVAIAVASGVAVEVVSTAAGTLLFAAPGECRDNGDVAVGTVSANIIVALTALAPREDTTEGDMTSLPPPSAAPPSEPADGAGGSGRIDDGLVAGNAATWLAAEAGDERNIPDGTSAVIASVPVMAAPPPATVARWSRISCCCCCCSCSNLS